MPTLITPVFKDELAINIDALLKDFNEEDFFEMCRQNPDLRFEMSKEGNIIIMPPTGGETSSQNFPLIVRLGVWAEKTEQARDLNPMPCLSCPTAPSVRLICHG